MKEHAAGYETPYWKSSKEYWHMFWNNVVLLSIWVVMCWAFGTVLFFSIYVVSVSIAGGGGVILFTVQHHIHHLSASIPNYCLVKCHNEFQHLFPEVTRVTLSQVHNALKCILWDTHAQRIISIAEYRQQI